ncbi:MAG: Cyclohexane,2-dione hydrolase [Bradyrhizobium sp.]|nr:Cyclohexane,2-dione hydrolase [Bradyrhizobium sp.]
MALISGATAIVQTLKEYGAEIIFGFIGHSTHEIANTVAESGIRTINPATELGGAYMAIAYNYLRDAPAAVGIWHTVGSLLVVPALQEANSSRIPSVHLGFNADSRLTHRDGLQQVPSSLFDHVTRFNARVERVDKIGETIHRAFKAAQGIPVGAAYVDIPFDIAADRSEIFVPRGWRSPEMRTPPSLSDVAETVRLLRAAKRPLIIVGGGAVRSGAGPEISRLVELLGIPFVTTTTAQGIVPETHPLALGTAGMAGWTCANDAVKEADFLVVLGSRLADWGIAQGFTARLAPMVQVDLDLARLGEFYFPALPVVADVRDFVMALNDELETAADVTELRSAHNDYRALSARRKSDWHAFIDAQGTDNQFPASPWRIMAEVRAAMSVDDILVADIGNHSWWVLQGTVMAKPRKILMSLGEGVLGSAVPMGIGAKLAHPESAVFVATGDGAAQYHLNELRVAVEHDVPVIIVIFNNGMYDANEQMMRGKFGKGSWTKFNNPDYVGIARAYGADGEKITTVADIGPALKRAIASGKPYVIDVPISIEIPFVDNHASGPIFMIDGREIPADTTGTLVAGEHRASRGGTRND